MAELAYASALEADEVTLLKVRIFLAAPNNALWCNLANTVASKATAKACKFESYQGDHTNNVH